MAESVPPIEDLDLPFLCLSLCAWYRANCNHGCASVDTMDVITNALQYTNVLLASCAIRPSRNVKSNTTVLAKIMGVLNVMINKN